MTGTSRAFTTAVYLVAAVLVFAGASALGARVAGVIGGVAFLGFAMVSAWSSDKPREQQR